MVLLCCCGGLYGSYRRQTADQVLNQYNDAPVPVDEKLLSLLESR